MGEFYKTFFMWSHFYLPEDVRENNVLRKIWNMVFIV